MKILHTVENLIGGMGEVVVKISNKLAERGHLVSIATKTDRLFNEKQLNKNIKLFKFNLNGNFSLKIKGDIEKYQNFLLNSNFDIITNFAAQQPLTDVMIQILDKIKAKKVFVPTGFSALYNRKYRKYFDNMKLWMNKYDMNIFLSNDYQDINFAFQNSIKNIIVIPNGADEDEFSKKHFKSIRDEFSIPKDDFLIIHVGSHTGIKGHKEAIKIFKMANIKNTTFLIIGHNFNNKGCWKLCNKLSKKLNKSNQFKVNKKFFLVEMLSRERVVEFYHEADLFLFPSNIECSPIVLFEAMASKTPFLVTNVGNSKEIIKWSNGGLLLPTFKTYFSINYFKDIFKIFYKIITLKIFLEKPVYSKADIRKSALMLENLYNNKNYRSILANNGYNAWKNKFTWDKIAKEYEYVYKKII